MEGSEYVFSLIQLREKGEDRDEERKKEKGGKEEVEAVLKRKKKVYV